MSNGSDRPTNGDPGRRPVGIVGQASFDPLGPTVRSMRTPAGRVLHYIDDGPRDGTVLLFHGGAATTVRAAGLMEFVHTFRYELGIRIVSVERNGIGQTDLDPDYTTGDYAHDSWWLADALGIETASVLCISGGGPFAAAVAAAAPERVRSMHVACSVSETLPGIGPDTERTEDEVRALIAHPMRWWGYGEESPVHRIPGYTDSTYEEGLRAFFVRGQLGDPSGLIHEARTHRMPMPDLRAVQAPAYLYWGENDRLVPTAHMDRWAQALPHVRARRLYPGEGHDVQYRHWDQILFDVARLGTAHLVSNDGGYFAVDDDHLAEALAGGEVLGLAAWRA